MGINLSAMRRGWDGGKQLILPAHKGGQGNTWVNKKIPNPYSEDATQMYPIGTKFIDDDCVWRYMHAGNECTRGRLVQSYNAYSSGTTRERALIAVAGAVGDTTVTCTAQGTVTASMFAGGYIIVTSTGKLVYRIEDNTAAAAGDTFTCKLAHPLRNTIGTGDYLQCVRGKYADVRYLSGSPEAGMGSAVGAAHWTVTSGYYFWGQTWGPCSITGTDNVGASLSERGLVMGTDGAVKCEYTAGLQYIGYLIPYTGPSTSGVDLPAAWLLVELQLAP